MKDGLYEFEDCRSGSFHEMDFAGKILVLSPDYLKAGQRNEHGQLWLATGGSGCQPGAVKGTIHTIRLSDSQGAEFRRGKFYGAIHPRLLPYWAREAVANICVGESTGDVEALYGFSVTADGQLLGEVPLSGWKTALEYIRMQMEYQDRIEITDARSEYIVATVDVKKNSCSIVPGALFEMAAELQGLRHEPGQIEGFEQQIT